MEKEIASKQPEIKFLSDAPLGIDNQPDIRFEHLGIVENLKKTILNYCSCPFTIGLFGKWGIGKTTIINILKNELELSGVPVVTFDVWKHENDALRRTFLKEILKQLKEQEYLKSDINLNDRVDQQITEEIKGDKIIFSTPFLIALMGSLFICALIGGILWKYNGITALNAYASTFTGGTLTVLILMWLLRKVLISITTKYSRDKFEDPQEFIDEFGRIVENVSFGDIKKLVLIIDNLDRAFHKKAVELLSTIKTFLENKECVFLIACDDKAIKEHIESVYLNDNKNNKKDVNKDDNTCAFKADEFLRKFFNTFILIPPFIDTELQTYTEKLLAETGVSQLQSSDVAFAVTTAFRDNPRQIKQIINTILSHFLLAKVREEKGKLIPVGTVTENPAFLAKILIIRQKFPSYYQKIASKFLSSDEMDITVIAECTETEEYQRFMVATIGIRVQDVRPFIFFRQSVEELSIPGSKELELALIEGQEKTVEEYLKKLKPKQEQLDALQKNIISSLERNKGLALFNIIHVSLNKLKQSGITLKIEFYDRIANLLISEPRLASEIIQFPVSLIFEEILDKCKPKHRERIIKQYISIFAKNIHPNQPIKYISDLLNNLLSHKDWIVPYVQEIKNTITAQYYNNIEFLSFFKDKPDVQKTYLSEETLIKIITEIAPADLEGKDSPKAELLKSLFNAITPNVIDAFILQCTPLLKKDASKPFGEAKENLLRNISEVLIKYEPLIKEINEDTRGQLGNPVLEELTKYINMGVAQLKIYVPLGLILVRAKELRHPRIGGCIQKFFELADVESIEYVLSFFEPKVKAEIIKSYGSLITGINMHNQNFFDLLLPIAPKEIRIQWLANLIKSPAYLKIFENIAKEEVNYGDKEYKIYLDAIFDRVKSEKNYQVRNELIAELRKLPTGKKGKENKAFWDEATGFYNKMIEDEKASTKEMTSWTATHNPQHRSHGATIKELQLNGKSLRRLSFKIKSSDSHWRAGFKLEDPNARDKMPDLVTRRSLLSHATRTNNNYELTTYRGGSNKSQNPIHGIGGQDISLRIERDNNNIVCFVNDILVWTYTIDPELFKKVYLAAWGDGKDFKVDFYDINFTLD